MERKLLMDDQKTGGYPAAFWDADVTIPGKASPSGRERQKYLEGRILRAFRRCCPKMRLGAVEYGNIKEMFPRAKVGITSGVIVEEFEIPREREAYFRERECYTFLRGEGMSARRIAAYVYMPLPASAGRSEGRNAMISQTLFPTLIDYMEEYMAAPCYEPANHPIYLINVSQRDFTASTIRRAVASLAFVGFRYIDVFRERHPRSIDLKKVPRDLKSYLREYDAQFEEYYREETDLYESPYMRICFGKKQFAVKRQAVEERLIEENGAVHFHGSDEKFYWMEIYPMIIAACRLGYQTDISEYREFCGEYRDRFAANSIKMHRCQILLDYFEKYLYAGLRSER